MSIYNRYIPHNGIYTRITVNEPPPRTDDAPPVPPPQPPPSGGRPLFELSGLLGKGEGSGVSALLRALKLDSLDRGDVLLLLIVLFLLAEGDELELVIALGLVLIMALNAEKDG